MLIISHSDSVLLEALLKKKKKKKMPRQGVKCIREELFSLMNPSSLTSLIVPCLFDSS
jgi:hypothetical protein